MNKFFKIISYIVLGLFIVSSSVQAARDDTVWDVASSSYVKTTNPLGYNVLINGTNKYLNFLNVSGSSGYGFRDNAGGMEYKNSGGSWLPLSGLGLSAIWGSITGTLSDQTDLQSALDAKQDTLTLGTGVETALAVDVGSAGAFVVNGGVLGTPSSGTVTNLTGTASININGTVGATTPSTGAFTSLSTTGNIVLTGSLLSDLESAGTTISGGISTTTGANIRLTGSTNASPNETRFYRNSSLSWTIDASGHLVPNGSVTVGLSGTPVTAGYFSGGAFNGTIGATTPSTGAFTTITGSGITLTDNTSGVNVFLTTNNSDSTGSSVIDLINDRADDLSKYIISYGSTHASQPDQLSLKNTYGNITLYTGSSGTASLSATITTTGINSTAIGATTPSTGAFTTLSASTSVSTPSLITASGALTITPASGSNLNVSLATTGDFAVNTNQLYVDTSLGYVGIGTTAPKSLLNVQTSIDNSLVTINNAVAGLTVANIGTTAGQYSFIKMAAWGASDSSGDGRYIQAYANSNNNIDMIFGQYDSAPASVEHLRITNAGNVGIGTGATVNAKLNVRGTTEQLRLGYDTSNYFSTTVGINGGVTFDAVGSNAQFAFSDAIRASSGTSLLPSYSFTNKTDGGMYLTGDDIITTGHLSELVVGQQRLLYRNLSANITVDSTATGVTTSAENTVTASHTLGSGSNRIVMVGISMRKGSPTTQTISGVSYDTGGTPIAMTYLTTAVRSGAQVEIWYLKEASLPAAGTYTVIATIASAATDRMVMGVSSFFNVDQTTTFGTANTATGSSTNGDVTVTSSLGDLVYGVIAKQNSTDAISVAGGETSLFNTVSTAGGDGSSNRIRGGGSYEAHTTGTSSTTMSWSWSTSRPWAMVGVALKPVIAFTDRLTIDSNGDITASGRYIAPKLQGYTVATLPAGTVGMMAYVTDALAPTYGAVVTGGGAVVAKVFYDGTNWTTQ